MTTHRERREEPNVTYREVDGDTIQIRDRQNRQEYKDTGIEGPHSYNTGYVISRMVWRQREVIKSFNRCVKTH